MAQFQRNENRIDYFDHPFWNQVQTLSWILHQDKSLVWLAWAAGENNDYHWPEALHLREPDEPRPAFGDIMQDGLDDDDWLDTSKAREILRIELMKGRLTAKGRKNNGGDWEEIPSVCWTGTHFHFESPPYAGPIEKTGPGVSSWHDVQFQPSEVLNLWPDPDFKGTKVSKTGSPGKKGRPSKLRDKAGQALRQIYPVGKGEGDTLASMTISVSERIKCSVSERTVSRAYKEAFPEE